MKEFKEILKELRNSKCLSQEALGSILHVSRSAIAKYENGLGLPSEEVIEAMCNYFEVNKDYLFPKDNAEQLITDKNIKINKLKRRTRIIVISLSLVIIVLLSTVAHFLFFKNEDVEKFDASMSVDINKPTDYQKDLLLFKYPGGYVYQRLEIHCIEFTSFTNLYLIRVHNSYTNGYMATTNDNEGFKESEYTEKVYMDINLLVSQNIRPVASWAQKKSTSYNFSSQFPNGSNNILFDGSKDLFDGAMIERNDDQLRFIYDNSNIKDNLLDKDYSKIVRKCDINNGRYYSSWEYEMVDDYSRKVTFPIYSSYLIEAKPNSVVKFEVNTRMVNTNMSVRQKKTFQLSI